MLLKSKILVAAVAASVCVSAAMAEGAYIGVEADYSFKSNLEMKFADGDYKADDGQAGLGLKAGYDFGAFRAYGAYIYDFEASKNGSDDTGFWSHKWKTHKFLVGADYTPEITSGFKVVVGTYTGLSILKMEAPWADVDATGAITGSGKDNESFKGWVIGAKVGGIYEINAHNEIEFGYKFDRTDYDKSSKLEISDMKEKNHGIYLGYNYKF